MLIETTTSMMMTIYMNEAHTAAQQEIINYSKTRENEREKEEKIII